MDKFYHLLAGLVIYRLFRLLGIYKVTCVLIVLFIAGCREAWNFQGFGSFKDLLATVLFPYILMRTEKESKNEN